MHCIQGGGFFNASQMHRFKIEKIGGGGGG